MKKGGNNKDRSNMKKRGHHVSMLMYRVHDVLFSICLFFYITPGSQLKEGTPSEKSGKGPKLILLNYMNDCWPDGPFKLTRLEVTDILEGGCQTMPPLMTRSACMLPEQVHPLVG